MVADPTDTATRVAPFQTRVLQRPAAATLQQRAAVLPLARPSMPDPHRKLHVAVKNGTTGADPERVADKILARDLIETGLISEDGATAARTTAQEMGLPLARILLVRGSVAEGLLLDALSRVYRLSIADMPLEPPDTDLAHVLPRHLALGTEAVPLRIEDGTVIVATARPDLFDSLARAVPQHLTLRPVLARRDDIQRAQTRLWGAGLAREAEMRAPELASCRSWHPGRALRVTIAALIGLALLWLLVPTAGAVGLFALAGLAFVLNMALKIAAFVTSLLASPRSHGTAPDSGSLAHPLRPLVFSMLVPLYKEPEIAGRLVAHLSRLRYPPEQLDIILLMEADDAVTAEALARADIPPHIRVITVPEGEPRTKPRALNYALPFIRGDIVGIYDAEDRPDPNQIADVARRFEEVEPDVACLQGRLDYYNADHNLMARLFTVEYAAWFRVLLPGVARMGLFVPLGGTTLFLRRSALEDVGAWDAHNVTEDAELGLRLARAGYRTELIETTTFEEANAAVVPWVLQRSRWLKGYLITYASAMRQPGALLRDLGAWRFFGLQAQMLSAVLGFFLAPLLWSLVVLPFGVPHPLDGILLPQQALWIGVFMMACFAISVAISVHACAAPHLRHLRKYAPLVELYYTIGTVAAWIGALELTARPFFWAKTRHGVYGSLPTDLDASFEDEAPWEGSSVEPDLAANEPGLRQDNAWFASSFKRTTKAMDR